MRVVGLTGGIASGKSTVARMLAELGAQIVDADQMARQVVEPGQPAYQEIVGAFGDGILQADPSLGPLRPIDRKKLGALVFADVEKRARLNAITHPRIGAATQQKLAALGEAGHKIAVYEAALLVENGMHRAFGGLIVAACSEAHQLARLSARDGISAEEAHQRIAAQAPLADKIAAATWVIDTDGTLDDTRRQVGKVWAEIVE